MNMADPNESAAADDLIIGDITEQNQQLQQDQDPEAVLQSFREEWRRELKGADQEQGSSQPGGFPHAPDTPSRTPQRQPKPVRTCNPSRSSLAPLQRITERGEDGDGSLSDLVNNNGGNSNHSGRGRDQDCVDVELKATELFNQAVELEKSGRLYEAIQHYRRAMVLVPDIEFRVHRLNTTKDARTDVSQPSRTQVPVGEMDAGEAEDDDELQDLVSRFQMCLAPAQAMCSPGYDQEAAHISCLPPEMLDRILHWVVGFDLDMRSLEQVSRVCQGFYLLARNPEIWHKACCRVWGLNCGGVGVFGSWRQMFIERPHPRLHGCYISRTTYFRAGESNFQDQNYKPWHLVQYFRYVRFFPDGQVTMLTTPEEPGAIVAQLRTKELKHPQAVRGVYRIHGPSVLLVLKRHTRDTHNRKKSRRHQGGTTDVMETTFQIEFEIRAVKKRPHWQLSWQSYSIASKFYDDRQNLSQLEVNDTSKFPPLMFSRVKSYTADSDLPLI